MSGNILCKNLEVDDDAGTFPDPISEDGAAKTNKELLNAIEAKISFCEKICSSERPNNT